MNWLFGAQETMETEKLTTMLMGDAGKREYEYERNPIQFPVTVLAVQADESKGNKAPFSFLGFPYYLV